MQVNERLELLFDNGKYTELNSGVTEKDSVSGVVTAFGKINGSLVYVYAQNIEINSGAFGKASAEKIAKLYDLAAKTGNPIVGMFESCGAYVDGTAESLKAYGKVLSKVSKVSGVVPQISLITGICAGSQALIATSSDFMIMTKEAKIYLTPAFDNEIAGTTATAVKNGICTIAVYDDKEAIDKVKKLLSHLPQNNLQKGFVNTEISDIPSEDIFDSDSSFRIYENYGKNATTGFARLNGTNVGVINVDSEVTSRVCKKVAKFVKILDAYNIPIITILNTEGFAKDIKAEIDGSLKYMSAMANSYSEATTPKIAVIMGKAIGIAFTAFTNTADFIIATPDSVIAPLAPQTYVQFAEKDSIPKEGFDRLTKKYEQGRASAKSAMEQGVVDIISEKENLRADLINLLITLDGKRQHKLPKKHGTNY